MSHRRPKPPCAHTVGRTAAGQIHGHAAKMCNSTSELAMRRQIQDLAPGPQQTTSQVAARPDIALKLETRRGRVSAPAGCISAGGRQMAKAKCGFNSYRAGTCSQPSLPARPICRTGPDRFLRKRRCCPPAALGEIGFVRENVDRGQMIIPVNARICARTGWIQD